MAFKKTINANNTEVVKTGSVPFPVGRRFVYDGRVWTVREAFADSGEDFRRIISSSGDDEILTLKSLMKDAQDCTDVS